MKSLSVILLVLILIAALCVGLLFANSIDRVRALQTALANERSAAAVNAESAERKYDFLLGEKIRLEKETADLKGIILDYDAQNDSLRKQLTAAQQRPTTFTVYQEKYPGSPIGKSPFALRFHEEGILRTGCGNFIFRMRR